MALTEKLRAIGDAVRAQNGSDETYTLDQMPEAIRRLSGKQLMLPGSIPEYVRQEVNRVAAQAWKYIHEDSIVFLAMSDGHYYGSEGTQSDGLKTNAGNIHAAMAMKALAYLLPVDFVAHLGDVAWGDKKTTPEVLKTQIDDFVAYIQEARAEMPVFLAIGNHDPGIYYHNVQTDGQVHTLPGAYLYDTFTAKSASADTVFGDPTYGGYCYRDFPDKKLRVFLMNTSDSIVKNQLDDGMLGSQRAWLANGLLELNSKSDATEWNWILLCHYPADYGGNMPLGELLKAYVEGENVTIIDENGVSKSADFSGHNGAKLIGQFHGHVHNFTSAKLSSYATGEAVQYDAWRVCIPNAQYNRENYYSTVGNYTDVDFSEPGTYTKTPDSEQDTSFVVNVIDPGERVIHSVCYGAGYDRTIGYGATEYFSIVADLKNVELDHDANAVVAGESYQAQLTWKEKYELSQIKVTMNGVDITAKAYDAGSISIGAVTGNVTITAVATRQYVCTNQVRLSQDSTGAVYNGGAGYKDGYALTSSGTEVDAGGFTVTGFMPIERGVTIRFGGSAFSDISEYGWRFACYNENFEFIHNRNGAAWINAGEIIQEDDTAVTWKPNDYTITQETKYCRISCRTGANTASVNGKDLIITFDELID